MRPRENLDTFIDRDRAMQLTLSSSSSRVRHRSSRYDAPFDGAEAYGLPQCENRIKNGPSPCRWTPVERRGLCGALPRPRNFSREVSYSSSVSLSVTMNCATHDLGSLSWRLRRVAISAWRSGHTPSQQRVSRRPDAHRPPGTQATTPCKSCIRRRVSDVLTSCRWRASQSSSVETMHSRCVVMPSSERWNSAFSWLKMAWPSKRIPLAG